MIMFIRFRFAAGAGKYPCTWPGCNKKFDRLEKRKAHVAKDHQHADERKLNPRRVARNEHFFLYVCRKGVRGKGELAVVFGSHLTRRACSRGNFLPAGRGCTFFELNDFFFAL